MLSLSRFTAALVYCALTMFATYEEMSADLFLNSFVSGAIEIPINIVAVFLVEMKFLGRRGSSVISLVAAGLLSFVCALLILFGKVVKGHLEHQIKC